MLPMSIPTVVHERFDREGTLRALKAAGASRVFLAIDRMPGDANKREAILARLKENIAFFRENGLEVGVWFWTFWLNPAEYPLLDGERMVVADGRTRPEQYCPASPAFVESSIAFIRELAQLGPDLLMFDDDYRFGFLPLGGVGCYCAHHMKRVEEMLGEPITREELVRKIYAGGKNRFRDAWQRALGESLEEYAVKVRETVDSVNPSIRFALCSVMSQWDVDGIDSVRIAKILAGGTKPLLRLIGAPYWAVEKNWGNRLAHIVELERMESAWCKAQAGTDMEIMPEGDVYPRPRHMTPANYLEGFDTAMRASGAVNATFKYMLDYTAAPDYENGYIRRHVRNTPVYEQLETLFGGKDCAGVRVYEAMRKFPDADMTDIAHPEEYALNLFFSRGARMLVDNTIPTVYEGKGCAGIAIGENARHLQSEDFEKGLILDIRAARILMEKGVDVGIAQIGDAHSAGLLYDAQQDAYVQSYYADNAYAVHLKEQAQVVGWAMEDDTRYPDAFRYVNAQGQKFFVYAFDASFVSDKRWRSYLMQRQLISAVKWLSGEALPAICEGNPDLYMLCRKSEDAMAVGLWNFYADDVEAPIVELERAYEDITFIGCEGSMVGNRVYLSRMEPYGMAAFEVRGEKQAEMELA